MFPLEGRCLAAAVLVLCAGGCGGDEPALSGAISTRTPVSTFAPMLNIHPRERLLPMSADAFISASALRWRDGDCGDVTIARAPAAADAERSAQLAVLDASRLAGNPPYRHAARRMPGCGKVKVFASSDYTRPYDPSRDNTIAPDEGFYLDLDDAARVGTREIASGRPPQVDVPVYYDRTTRENNGFTYTRLTYSVLFGMERKVGPSVAAATAYEGDWKWIRVLLKSRAGEDEYAPIAVRYGVRSRYMPWRRVAKAGVAPQATHPSIFVARGSHALYPRPGRYDRPVTIGERRVALADEARGCPDCIAWRSWRSLKEAREQPWYGYGGAWGESLGWGGAAAGLGPTPWGEATKDKLVEPGKLE